MNKILIGILISVAVLILALGALVIYEASSVTIKKPAVYLYPLEDSVIKVQLEINGKLIQDIPEYNLGWNVFVTKEGIIENKYDYLFYEAKLKKIELPDQGWIIKYEDLDSWFELNLIKLGLNQKEKNQFKEYWLKELPESNYYEIKLLQESFLKENMNLIIFPQPDTLIRLNFYFKPIKEKIDILEPVITTPERTGFTVVEWGGMIDN
ncbi:MAG TPA: hypothetical protein VJA23_00010 [Candidatus Nanoarchaeia archaeon]|nr:hypothetical protein [Candidatus Nanoarchaeia archaeon]